ncbi:MAG: preprotein translocase subunit SecE [Bryobacteraceae bacterium]|jgi:preprotein translocase SecE subunit|nr:preprotein translocase subunit SecE [Bryobacteraceae bacterium]
MENERLPEKSAASWPQRVKDYVTDLQAEMRRVTWPSWKQVRATTTVVVVAVFAFSAYFRAVDFVVERGVARIFTTFAK